MYRSGELIEAGRLPKRFKGARAFSTSIYFLLKGNQKSLFHKLKSDELWHYYDGSPVLIHIIDKNKNHIKKVFGKNLEEGHEFQIVIPEGNWFAAEVIDKKSFSFFGCTVAPGFDFSDFELAERKKLLEKFPLHEKLIKKFTTE